MLKKFFLINTVFLLFGCSIAPLKTQFSLQQKKNRDIYYEMYAKAIAGDKEAQFQLGTGQHYIGTTNNRQKWIISSANQGYSTAQWYLGLMYLMGEGMRQDYKEAFQWFKKSAENGNVVGQFYLAACYLLGKGTEQNYTESVRWLEKASDNDIKENDYMDSVYERRLKKEFGKKNGTTSHLAHSTKKLAIALLAHCYTVGLGVKTDMKKAIQLYKKIDVRVALVVENEYAEISKIPLQKIRTEAQNGSLAHQAVLGLILFRGMGVKQDYDQAVTAEAIHILGVCYTLGLGVKQDFANAYQCLDQKSVWVCLLNLFMPRQCGKF